MKILSRTFFIIILINAVMTHAGAQGLSGEWKLAEARQNGKGVPLGSVIRATLSFSAEHRISGNAGCNRYSTVYKLESKNRISFEPIISTKMACLDNYFMRQETAFFGVMEKVDRYRIKSNQLIFSDAAGKNVLRFARAGKEKK